jgi:hypothetical protein
MVREIVRNKLGREGKGRKIEERKEKTQKKEETGKQQET